jgi:hypothetical protein
MSVKTVLDFGKFRFGGGTEKLDNSWFTPLLNFRSLWLGFKIQNIHLKLRRISM